MDQIEELLDEWNGLEEGEKDAALEITHAALTAWQDTPQDEKSDVPPS